MPSFTATGQQLISVWVRNSFLNTKISHAALQDNGIHNLHQENKEVEQQQKKSSNT